MCCSSVWKPHLFFSNYTMTMYLFCDINWSGGKEIQFGLDSDWLFNGDLWCRELLRSRLRHSNILSLLLFCLSRPFVLVIYGAQVSAERLELMCACTREREGAIDCFTFVCVCVCVSTLHSVRACVLLAHWDCVYVYSCVPLHLRDVKCALSLFIFTFFLSHPFLPFSLCLHYTSLITSLVPPFSLFLLRALSSRSFKTYEFVVTLYLCPSLLFPAFTTSPTHPPSCRL